MALHLWRPLAPHPLQPSFPLHLPSPHILSNCTFHQQLLWSLHFVNLVASVMFTSLKNLRLFLHTRHLNKAYQHYWDKSQSFAIVTEPTVTKCNVTLSAFFPISHDTFYLSTFKCGRFAISRTVIGNLYTVQHQLWSPVYIVGLAHKDHWLFFVFFWGVFEHSSPGT